MRPDLEIVAARVNAGARVLDLGCGDGDLLDSLKRDKQVNGYGLEIDPDKITHCVRRGLNVIEQNLDAGLSNFEDQSFDMVVMTETLQSVRHPDRLLEEMLRIGTQCMVTFPNFAYWRCRLALSFKGRMPVARHLPHSWYETPNIHLCSIRDFEQLCAERGVRVLERLVVDADHRRSRLAERWANLYGAYAFYRLGR